MPEGSTRTKGNTQSNCGGRVKGIPETIMGELEQGKGKIRRKCELTAETLEGDEFEGSKYLEES